MRALPRVAAGASLLTLAAAITAPSTNVTFTTRACQPPHDTFPFCDTTRPLAERVADLLARLQDADVPPQLTARHGPGQAAPYSNVSYLGIPEWDWGMNAQHVSRLTACWS
jgi:hypothetical protein